MSEQYGDPRFHKLIEKIAELHERKQRDYGTKGDPFANVRASEEIGIPAWKGAWCRARDKVKRIDKYCKEGNLANESVEDSWLDLAVYCLICHILHGEIHVKPDDSGGGTDSPTELPELPGEGIGLPHPWENPEIRYPVLGSVTVQPSPGNPVQSYLNIDGIP